MRESQVKHMGIYCVITLLGIVLFQTLSMVVPSTDISQVRIRELVKDYSIVSRWINSVLQGSLRKLLSIGQ